MRWRGLGWGEWGPHSVHAATPSAHMRAQAGLRRVEGEGGVVQIAGTGHGRPLAATPMLQGRRPAVLPGPTGASRGGRADAAAAYLPGALGRRHGQHSTGPLLEAEGLVAVALPSANYWPAPCNTRKARSKTSGISGGGAGRAPFALTGLPGARAPISGESQSSRVTARNFSPPSFAECGWRVGQPGLVQRRAERLSLYCFQRDHFFPSVDYLPFRRGTVRTVTSAGGGSPGDKAGALSPPSPAAALNAHSALGK